MSHIINFFKTPLSDHQIICLGNFKNLTGLEAVLIREDIEELLTTEFNTIYIDASNVISADLSGINEIIHSNYTLQNAAKQLVFVYRKNSEVEKWVETTSLHQFVDTALMPSY
jgi:hypothetical protein